MEWRVFLHSLCIHFFFIVDWALIYSHTRPGKWKEHFCTRFIFHRTLYYIQSAIDYFVKARFFNHSILAMYRRSWPFSRCFFLSSSFTRTYYIGFFCSPSKSRTWYIIAGSFFFISGNFNIENIFHANKFKLGNWILEWQKYGKTNEQSQIY